MQKKYLQDYDKLLASEMARVKSKELGTDSALLVKYHNSMVSNDMSVPRVLRAVSILRLARQAIKKPLSKADRDDWENFFVSLKTQGKEMQKPGAVPDGVVGSVHALTQEGQALVASNTGSRLLAYAYGAGKVIWVVGAQKIVQNAEEGRRRIREYAFPLEDERALKAYGVHSGVNKMMLFNKELVPGRIMVILVKEKLGF